MSFFFQNIPQISAKYKNEVGCLPKGHYYLVLKSDRKQGHGFFLFLR